MLAQTRPRRLAIAGRNHKSGGAFPQSPTPLTLFGSINSFMSNRSLLIALAVALLLGLVTLIVATRPQTGAGAPGSASATVAPGERVLSFDPARVKAIRVLGPGPGARTDIIERTGAELQWQMRSIQRSAIGMETPSELTWRMDASRIRAILDILSNLTAVAAAPADSKLGDNPATVTISMLEGPDRVIKLASRTLGGQGIIEATGPVASANPAAAATPAATAQPTRLALVNDQVHNMFNSPGPRGWRDLQLLPRVATDASQIRIVGGTSGGVALGKIEGKWGLREPVGAPADAPAIQRLLSVLENIRVVRFFDDGVISASNAGLESPVARVLIGTDAPGNSDAAAAQIELLVGGSADPQNKTRYVSRGTSGAIVSVETDTLSRISTNPEDFIAGQITTLSAPDIGLIMFKGTPVAPAATADPAPAPAPEPVELGFRRDLTNWLELRPGGKEVMQDPARVKQIEGMLEFLTTQRAVNVSLTEPVGYVPVGAITLLSTRGDPLDELEIATSGKSTVVVRTGKVYRGFSGPPDLLKSVFGPIEPPPAVGPDGKPIEKEIMK